MKDWTISSERLLDKVVEMTAYSIGAFLGDGSFRFVPGSGNGSCYVTEVTTMDKEVPERVAKEVNDSFETNYKIMERKTPKGTKMYIFRAYKKVVQEYFRLMTDNRHSVPKEILEGSRQVKLDFLAGIFDTDGSVKFTETWNGSRTKKNPRWQLGFTNTVPEMVMGVGALLHGLGVKVGKFHIVPRGGYRTQYAIYPNIKDFIKAGCYFQASRKEKRLHDYLNHVLGSETMHTAPVTSGDDIVQS